MNTPVKREKSKEVLSDEAQLIRLVQMRCGNVSGNLMKAKEEMMQLQSHLLSIRNIVPPNSSPNSYSQLLQTVASMQSIIVDSIKTISGFYEKLRMDIDSNIVLDNIPKPEGMLQTQDSKLSNVYNYCALSSFCSRLDTFFPSIADGTLFESLASKLAKEIREDRECDSVYHTLPSIEAIQKFEKLEGACIPIGIDRILDLLYNTRLKQVHYHEYSPCRSRQGHTV